MASLASITQSVVDILDEPFNYMLYARVEDSVIGCRATLIRQEFTKTRMFPSYALYEVTIPISLEDCGCANAFTTQGDFPDIISFKEVSPFSFVGTDGRKSIGYILPEEIELYQFNKISRHLPRYTYMNKKPYLFNVGNIDNVLFRGPFADPRQLKQFNCSDGYCFDEEDDNFFEEHFRPIIIKMVLEEVGRKATDDHNIQVNGE